MAGAPEGRAGLSVRAKWLLSLALVSLVALSVHRLRQAEPGADNQPAVFELSGASMGTRYHAKVVRRTADGRALSRAAVQEALERALDSVDRAMSTYRPDSELSRFNTARSTDPIALSIPLREVFRVALEVGQASGGALDVTIAPLVEAWGFGPDAGSESAPEDLSVIKRRIGLDKLQLTKAGLKKAHPLLRCDLSAVAKGYAVDLAAAELRALGAQSFLVEVGGELYAEGSRPGGEGWRVGIERPSDGDPAIDKVVVLRDQGMATSGDYRNFRMENGLRNSHLLDPRTGSPVRHGLASVTVVHRRVAVADAWATALSVLGPNEGMRLAESQGLAAQLVERMTEGGFSTKLTKAFRARYGAP